MKRRSPGFTLLELMAAVLIGSLVVLMTTSGIRTSMRSWEKVQTKISENYSRRNVLDLVRRQTSSLFLKQDAEQFALSPRFEDQPRRGTAQPGANGRGNQEERAPKGFNLPAGTDFFRGNVQELSFLSTVSFLSDFPGQAAVRYYVVQGSPDDSEAGEGLSSRSEREPEPEEELDPEPQMGGVEEKDNQPIAAEELEGNLYLVMEETNLFLSQTDGGEGDAGAAGSAGEPGDATAGLGGAKEDHADQPEAQVVSTHKMTLLGPMRKFTVRYRLPAKREVEDVDSDQDWAETWDVVGAGNYPTAIEFTFFYERPGFTDDIPTEELPGVRLIVPIYDPANMVRGSKEGAPF